jgi:hypothetical protein
MLDLQTYVLAHPPRCLSLVSASPVDPLEDRGFDSITFRLSSIDGQVTAEILGHSLSRYNPDYHGDELISPLFLSWKGRTDQVPLFDSDVHGYHGEMGDSAKLRGDGPPNGFRCPNCSGSEFTVSVQFDYGEACHDLAEDDPDLAVEDYFQNILVGGQCMNCDVATRVLDMDL